MGDSNFEKSAFANAAKEKNFISAVVYVHNAEKGIGVFLSELIALLEGNFEHSEIICVNDFSSDDSVAQIRLASENASTAAISILNMSCFHGLELAMNAGVDLAIGDFVLEIDSTIQDYENDEIMKVYRKVLEGFDIVSASAEKKQRFSSNTFYWFYKKFAKEKDALQTETFRILSRRAVNRINSMSRTVPYRKGVYANCGLKTFNMKYAPVQTEFKIRRDRNFHQYRRRLAVDTLLMFTDAGYTISKWLTMAMMFASLFMGGYSLFVYLMAKPVEGWTTTVLFLAAAFFGLFGILTIIIKYLQILLELNFRRTKYSFESIEKLTK